MIIKNARLISALTEGYSQDMADVRIAENLIADIQPCGFDYGTDDQVIDAAGATLMPGLLDIHAHLSFHSMAFLSLSEKTYGEEFLDCLDHANAYIKQGYTTIRDLGSAWGIALDVRNLIDRKRLKGPRVLSSGEIITPNAPGNSTFGEIYAQTDSPDGIRAIAREQIVREVDVLKYMATGAMLNRGGDPGHRIATVAELQALQEVAEINGVPTSVHCHGTEAIHRCIEVGINTIEHATLIDDKGIQLLLDNGEKSYLVPTYSVAYTIMGGPKDQNQKGNARNDGMAAYVTDEKTKVGMMGYQCIRKAYDAGLTLGWGSDIPCDAFEATPGLEFIARKVCSDFDDLEMLKQATIHSAKIVGLDDKIGTVKVGKIADLILVDGNPDQDYRAMCKPMIHVIRDGEVLI